MGASPADRDGERIQHLDAVRTADVVVQESHVGESRAGIGDPFVGKRDIVGVGALPVVPEHVVPKPEGDDTGFGIHIPAFCQIGLELQLFVIPEERHEPDKLLVLDGDVVLG